MYLSILTFSNRTLFLRLVSDVYRHLMNATRYEIKVHVYLVCSHHTSIFGYIIQDLRKKFEKIPSLSTTSKHPQQIAKKKREKKKKG